MKEFKTKMNESKTITDFINEYTCRVTKYLEMDYELQDYIFKDFQIKYVIKRKITYTEIMLVFPNDFVYIISVNLNNEDLPDFIELVTNIKYAVIYDIKGV